MAPTKVQTTNKLAKSSIIPMPRRPISTRASKNSSIIDGQNMMPPPVGKRKADASPLQNEKVKRSALGNVTNAVLNAIDDGKKGGAGAKVDGAAATVTKKATQTNGNNNAKVNVNRNQANVKSKTAAATTMQAIDAFFQPPNIVGIAPQRQTKVMTRAASRATQPSRSLASNIEKTVKLVAAVAVASTVATKENNNIATTVVKTKKKADSTTNNNNTSSNRNGSLTDSSSNGNDNVEMPKLNVRRISNDFDLNDHEDSHYVSALEDLTTTSMRLSMSSLGSIGDDRRKSTASTVSDSNDSMHTISNQSSSQTSTQSDITLSEDACTMISSGPLPVPDGVIDFDRENWDDPLQASHYAMDIFNYLKEREEVFQIDSYMQRQPHLTPWMRTLLVDWMVEVQETFELNHETLYLAVKIVDIYLSKVMIQKEKLQLLGAAALLMSCKYDERTPPLIDDFLYICDGAYNQLELTRMEMNMFRTIGFDLGIPLSYRFLRRYARCAKVTMPELTLARFILEFSLMNYDLITLSDSKIASACLFMALRMNNKTGWNKTLEYYSGYKLTDFESIVPMLNAALHQKQRDANKTIRNKYTHKVFFEVSKIPLMTDEKLFEPSTESTEIKQS